VLIVVGSVLGVPVAIVLVVVVVAVLPGLVTAGRRMNVRMLVFMHSVVGVIYHPQIPPPWAKPTHFGRRRAYAMPAAHGPFLATLTGMCLTCGCMDAHLQMGRSNIMYEDLKAAADENGRSVAETIDIMERTIAKDRGEHPPEYKA